MASLTAQHTVLLEIPELLEKILLHLDQRELLVNAQRVCRQWRQCITDTPSIQQHLFLLPEPARGRTSNADADKPRQNPLLVKDFPEWFMHGNTWPPDQRLRFVRTTEPYFRGYDRDVVYPESERITKRLEAYAYPQASWRRMLLLQPPPNGIGYITTRCGNLVKPDAGSEPQPNPSDADHVAPPVDRPVTMPEVLELTNRSIYVTENVAEPYADDPLSSRRAREPRWQEVKHAFSRFRVMWWRLSPDVHESAATDPDFDELYRAWREAMRL
ncbi:hypothetical protein PG996_003461 [Apiospora saccharicola]|uniref:F-box domain-containing protein n=1 Tax=Apiospora saccharicola TaxID=335842 RepID=A0ABR1W1C3_9PEZI